MKYLSLFSGIGGFELGIIKAYDNLYKKTQGERDKVLQRLQPLPDGESRTLRRGESSTCIGYSEIDKYATQIYQKHFPNHKNYGDITKINETELPDFDFLCGGFPCQSFSIAGKRGGFEDTRGTMFFEICRILKTKRPRLLLLENVKGLLSHDVGKTFETIIKTLDELGYDLQWQVINSKNHGVPQNGERVFIVGHLRGTSRPQVFPFGKADEGSDVGESSVSREVQSQDGGGNSGHSDIEVSQNGQDGHIHQLNTPIHSNDRVYGTDGIAPTLNTMQGGRRQPFVLEPEMKIRRLTPTECERLQGFPDGWTETGAKEPNGLNNYSSNMNLTPISDTQRYKVLGNAVTVNVIEAIMEKIIYGISR